MRPSSWSLYDFITNSYARLTIPIQGMEQLGYVRGCQIHNPTLAKASAVVWTEILP